MKRFLGLLLVFSLFFPAGVLGAGQSTDTLRRNLLGLEKTIREVSNRMDQLAEKSKAVSREVQAIKSDQQIGMIEHVRVEGLLSRLRVILIERRELKTIEQNFKLEREKLSSALHEVLGEEIRLLLRKGEEEFEDDISAAGQLHREVLLRMEERKRLLAHRSLRIPTLPQLEVPDIEGFSPDEQREIAILLRDDAETLEKEKAELLKERDYLQDEFQIKQALGRFRGFPRGLQAKPLEKQVAELKSKIDRIELAILGHDRAAARLFLRSEKILARAEEEEARLLK